MAIHKMGGAVNGAAPTDTKTHVVVTPETVLNRNTCIKPGCAVGLLACTSHMMGPRWAR